MIRVVKDNLVVVTVVAALTLAAVLLVYLPQGRKIQELQAATAAQKMATEGDREKSRVVPSLVREVEQMKSRYRNLDRRLPKQKELGGFLREISLHVGQEKLTNQFIEPGTPGQEDLFHTLPIIMKFQGKYLSTASFLKHIDEMERLTRVQKMVITMDSEAGKDAKDDSLLNVELQLNIYFTES